MNPTILSELANLFAVEAFQADVKQDTEQAEHLWHIADELHTKFEAESKRAALETLKIS